MRKIYLSLLSFFLFCQLSQAQVNNYSFSSASDLYEENTDASRVILGTATSDDQVFVVPGAGAAGPLTGAGLPIGFNFTFGGVVVDKFAVNNNGWIKLGTGATITISDAIQPIGGANGPGLENVVAGLARDLQAQTGAELSYQTVGTAPNRVLIVQWKNYKRYQTAATPTYSYNFQIRLQEAGNRVSVVYGPFSDGNTTSGAPQVGLRGATGAVFNNRTGVWASSTAGTTNTASMGLSSATDATPYSGLTYTWTPPPPCVPASLATGAGTATAPTATLCAGAPFTITVTGTQIGTGLSFQWERSPDGVSNWENVPGATSADLTTSTAGTTYYRRKITCSTTDAYSNVVSVNTTAPVPVPWTENFDALTTVGTNSFPTCWSEIGNTMYWATGTSTAASQHDPRSPNNYLFIRWSANADHIWTPAFNLVAGTSYDFSFWHAGDNYTGWQAEIIVANSPTSTATQLGGPIQTTAVVAALGYNKATRTFIPTVSGVYHFGIRVTANGTPFYLGFDDFEVRETPNCFETAEVTPSAITQTTATISWTPSVSTPANGYQWEVRSSGAAGSGATGLAASGTTAAGVTTANVTGLLPGTTYSVYVRSACDPTLFSAWSSAVTFNTVCAVISTFPYAETFETNSTTRLCWTVNDYVSGTRNWTYGSGTGVSGTPVSVAHGGTLNAQFFGNGSGNVSRLVSPALDFTAFSTTGAQVKFWYANPDWAGDQNELRVYYKTSAAGVWTLIPDAVYTSNTSAWTEVELILPGSTSPEYYIAFEGAELFGYGIGVDDVEFSQAPTCPRPGPVTTVSSLPTSMTVSFSGPAGSYIVEYGAPGFTPGTTNAAGGGTIAFGAGSPITITGLTAATTYDVYVRRICVPGVDYSLNRQGTGTTLCAATDVPYLQTFESGTSPFGWPTCTSVQDVNGNSGPLVGTSGGGAYHIFANTTSNQTYISPNKSLSYRYNGTIPTQAADDWYYIQGLNLTAGTTYRLKFYYKASDGPNWVEKFEVKYGTEAINTAMTQTLYTNTNVATALASPWDSVVTDFSPTASGVYYIGFHTMSDADQAFLYFEDISVRVAPIVDAGVAGLVNVPNCPAPNNVIQAAVRNFNLTTHDFATHPVTVTANITGSATLSINTVVNTGTLAAGQTLNVDLPAVTLAPGTYSITVTTSVTGDTETGNDAFTRNFTVYPSPAAPVLTPATPAICAGGTQMLTAAATGPVLRAFGTATTTNGATSYPAPYSAFWGGQRMQMLITAAELTAQGLVANSPISSISFDVASLGANWGGSITAAQNFKVSIGTTTLTALSAFQTGLTEVVAASNFTPTVGYNNTHTFAAPFTWNGASNLIIETTFSNNFSGAAADGVVHRYTTTAFNSTIVYRADDLDAATIAAGTTVNVTSPNRPNFRLGTVGTLPITWAPATGLFTDAAATVAYNGEPAASVYAKPAATQVYTATATSPQGCPTSTNFTVTVNPNPVITIAALPTTVCLSDESVALSATPAGGTWSGIGVSGNNFQPINTAIGAYTLTYTSTNQFNCTSRATTIANVVDCPERRILLRDNSLILFPNPNNGQFNFRVNTSLYNRLSMKVYNNVGMLVSAQEFTGLAFGRVVPVNLSSLASGNYMVHFYYDGGTNFNEKAFKVVIAR